MLDVCYFADEVSKTDFEEAIKLGVEAGANTVEIRGGIWGKHVTEIDNDDVKRVQDVLSTYNVRVASVGSPFGKCSIDDPQEYEQHRRHFDRMVTLAHAFDTQVIRGLHFGIRIVVSKVHRAQILTTIWNVSSKNFRLSFRLQRMRTLRSALRTKVRVSPELVKKRVLSSMRSEIVQHLPHAGMSITVCTAEKIRCQMDTPIFRDWCGISM